uniref:Tf2-1-like SH3-like domain-containing protein n=1 Tax=Cajanus cajan TaxID=3821 RepID=A0A151RUP6_CAJCA|nr:hypothetical protein KK1_032144 [Cajanus cajan]
MGSQESRDLAEFQKCHPPQFKGDTDPEVADHWICELEKIFTVLGCSQERRLAYVVYMLVEEAEHWWRGTHHMMTTRASRVFALIGAEAFTSSDLVKGKGRAASKDVMILFDSGASHSFISYACAAMLGVPVCDFWLRLLVLTPASASVVASDLCAGCPIVVNEKRYKVNLICLPLVDIDIILGMDWLSANRILIDYRFVGPYQIIQCVGPVAYRLALPPSPSNLHDVFHVSQLRKYVHDPGHVVELDDVRVKENLTFEKLLVVVVDHKLKELRGKFIALVKVLWDAATGEATWEVEQQCKEWYPFLFPSKFVFGDENSCCWGGCETPFRFLSSLPSQPTLTFTLFAPFIPFLCS